jgi:RecB family exonuclease
MSEAPPPGHLSVSSVLTYARCPLAWRRRYVERQAEPSSPAMSFGKAFALALEAYHRGGDAETVFARAHAEAGNAAPGAEHGLRLLDLYRSRFDLAGEPERRFSLYLPARDRVPVPIVGFIDLECESEVVEFKTSRNRWTQARADEAYQAAVYAWAFQQRHGRRPDHVRYLVFSTRAVEVQEIVTHPGGDDLRLFELAAIAAWRGIVSRQFAGCGRCDVCKQSRPDTRRPGEVFSW